MDHRPPSQPRTAGTDRTAVSGDGLSRRQMLYGAGAGLGAAMLGPILAPPGHPQAAAPGAAAGVSDVLAEAVHAEAVAGAGSRSLGFGQGWKFALVSTTGITDPTGAYANAQDPAFNDSGWQAVDVPHDWSIELAPVDSASTVSYNGFLPGGLGWYRKTFTLPPSLSGKRISIEFDGVYMNSDVYLNGKLLGNHPYAYTGFSYDLTGQVHTDGSTPNVIAVRAENQIPSSRWYSGSGIYRNVHLVVTDPVHVARHGTFVTTPGLASTIGAGYATVQVQADVTNDGSAAAPVTVMTKVRAPDGTVAAEGSSAVSVAAGQTGRSTTTMRVASPALWSTGSPNLYLLETSLVVGGSAVDATTTTFGIRYFSFDPAGGFSLNGRYQKLQGVDLHHTQGPLGAAVFGDSLRRQMQIAKSMGVNALRTAHNPPAPELTAVCEELGIVMMVEAFDCWHTGKVAYDYHLYFDAWSDSDIAEMVNAHKNSPAVVLWSIGNETPDTGMADGPPIAKKLIADVKAIDTTRPVVMGSDRYRSVPSPGSPQDQILQMLDGLGVNYNTAMSMDGLHAAYPGKFFFCSETSSETSTRGVYQDPQLLNTGENYTPGRRSTSSYDNNLASWCMSGEYELKKDRDRRFWQGGFLWSGQDYIGEPTPYNVFPVKSSFFGAVDTAGFPKDAYHLYRSQWSTAPMVHIVPMNWTDHEPGESVAVWVYSNVATVELLLNGRSLGTRSFGRKVTADGRPYLETTEPSGDDKNYPSGSYTSPNGSTGKLHLAWSVPFQPGQLVAVATDNGREVARDEVSTAGPVHAVTLTPDARTLTADGRSLSFITAEAVDSRGVTVPGAVNPVHLTVTGPGRLAGVDNGREENAASYQQPSVNLFNGMAVAVVRSTGQPGTIRVTASSPGLAPATATLQAAAPATAARPAAVPGAASQGTPAAAVGAVGAGQAALMADIQSAPGPSADASYSGAPETIPAAMLDGNLSTGWSNYYDKSATANLPPVSVSNPADWVSLTWRQPQRLAGISASFTTSAVLARPAKLAVSYWDGHRFAPVGNPAIGWATASNQPTTVTFDPVSTTALRLDMTSAAPATGVGFLQIAELSATPAR
jgi:beta-galactosidase